MLYTAVRCLVPKLVKSGLIASFEFLLLNLGVFGDKYLLGKQPSALLRHIAKTAFIKNHDVLGLLGNKVYANGLKTHTNHKFAPKSEKGTYHFTPNKETDQRAKNLINRKNKKERDLLEILICGGSLVFP